MTEQPIPYFWLMTTQVPTHNGFDINTLDGTVTIPHGTTRAAAYKYLRNSIAEEIGRADFTVLHFQLEPDQL